MDSTESVPPTSATVEGTVNAESEGAEGEGTEGEGSHAARLAHLDHELSKISLHYKHAAPKVSLNKIIWLEIIILKYN